MPCLWDADKTKGQGLIIPYPLHFGSHTRLNRIKLNAEACGLALLYFYCGECLAGIAGCRYLDIGRTGWDGLYLILAFFSCDCVERYPIDPDANPGNECTAGTCDCKL